MLFLFCSLIIQNDMNKKFKKIFISILFSFICFVSSTYAMTNSEYVNALEQRLFGVTYEAESMPSRIDRIEKQIYDNSYSGSSEERLAKIDKIYPKSEFETGKFSSFDNNYAQDYEETNEPSDYNNYPIINEIEEQIYNKNYSGEDIYKRLSRLEQELYGNIKAEDDLQQRVERLKSVLPKKPQERFTAQNLGFNDFGLKTPTEYKFDDAYAGSTNAISQLELNAFNKTFEKEKTSKRLDRLEHFYFGGVTIGKSNNDRINRLASVAMSSKNMEEYFPTPKGAQWAGILMNLLVFGLGFLL